LAATELIAVSGEDHLHAVARVYGPEAWDVYDELDKSLDPRGPDMLLDLAAPHLSAESRVLDVGCRDASHLIELVRRTGARGAGIDPLERFVERSRGAVAEAGLDGRVEIVQGAIQAIPYADSSFDLVWCRDVLTIVEDIDTAVGELARVLRPGGRLVVFVVFATDAFDERDVALCSQNLTAVPENLDEQNVEGAFDRAGLSVVVKDVVGTEWREYAEERTQPVSRALLRLARLRRERDRFVAAAGEDIVDHIESNLHWEVWQFLGKLRPTVYLLRKGDG
jgi:ubiquinone/menaquinone biosynthesis C-methylase UbiE